MRKETLKAAISVAALTASLAAYGDATITVSDGIVTATATVDTNGVGVYVNPTFSSAWLAVIVTARTKPTVGSASNPNIELDVAATSLTGAPLTITFSDNNFGPMSGTLNARLDGHVFSGAGGAVSYNTYYDTGNAIGAQTSLLTASGNVSPPYSSTANSPTLSANAFSLTQVITIAGGSGGNYSLAANLQANSPPPLTSLVIGPIAFNPQTGLYQQSVLFTNLSGVPVTGVRIAVLGLPSSVVLYNSAGSTNGAPYVEYGQTVAAGGGVGFLLEYYDATRQPFVSTNMVATAVAVAPPPVPGGTVVQLDRVQFISEGQLTIEFVTIPGHTYVVQYSADLISWKAAVPPIIANAIKTQWIDSGPPKTDSAPGSVAQRYYRVVQTN